MSQFDPPSGHPSDFDMDGAPERKQSNPAGIVGFILSLLCIPAPLGLLVSLFALTRRPKGFAIAGTIIGVLFTILLVIVFFLGKAAWPAVQGVTHFEQIKQAVATHQSANNGDVPADLAALGLPADVTTDPWGNPWGYEASADRKSFTLITLGPDGAAGTKDDRRLGSDMTPNQVGQELGQAIGDYYESKGKQPAPAPANTP